MWLSEGATTDGQLVTSYKIEASSGGGKYKLLASNFNTINSGYIAPAGETGATIGVRHLDDVADEGGDVRFTLLGTAGGKAANVTMMVFKV